MRASAIAAALVAVSSVSSAPLPLMRDVPQTESLLKTRDILSWGKNLVKTNSRTPLLTPGSESDIATVVKSMKSSDSFDASLDTPPVKPVEKLVKKEKSERKVPRFLWSWDELQPGDGYRLANSKYHREDYKGREWVSNGRLSKEKIFKGLVVGGWLGTGGYGISKLIECQKKDDEERAQGKEPKRWCSPKRRSPKRIHWERQ